MEIRRLEPADFDQLSTLLGVVYLADPSDERRERFQTLNENDRTFGAFDGDELVGSIGAFTFDVTVPGRRTLSMAGTTIVAVKPTHRRQGLLRQMMGVHFEDIAAHDEPLAGLWASEAPIYGRFGYGWATDFVDATISSGGRITGDLDESVTVRMTDRDGLLSVAPSLYEEVRLGEPGTISRSKDWWELRRTDDDPSERNGASGNRYAIARRGGEPVGYAIYRTKDEYKDGISTGEVRMREVLATDLDAELALWNFLFSIDLTTSVHIYARPIDDPLLHRLVDSRNYQRKVGDGMYVAVMDAPTALAGRAYSAPGSLTIRITDHVIAGTYALEVDESGEAAAGAADAAPDVTMDAKTLGAIYLGGRRANTMARAGLITGDESSIRLLDRVFQGAHAPLIRDGF